MLPAAKFASSTPKWESHKDNNFDDLLGRQERCNERLRCLVGGLRPASINMANVWKKRTQLQCVQQPPMAKAINNHLEPLVDRLALKCLNKPTVTPLFVGSQVQMAPIPEGSSLKTPYQDNKNSMFQRRRLFEHVDEQEASISFGQPDELAELSQHSSWSLAGNAASQCPMVEDAFTENGHVLSENNDDAPNQTKPNARTDSLMYGNPFENDDGLSILHSTLAMADSHEAALTIGDSSMQDKDVDSDSPESDSRSDNLTVVTASPAEIRQNHNDDFHAEIRDTLREVVEIVHRSAETRHQENGQEVSFNKEAGGQPKRPSSLTVQFSVKHLKPSNQTTATQMFQMTIFSDGLVRFRPLVNNESRGRCNVKDERSIYIDWLASN